MSAAAIRLRASADAGIAVGTVTLDSVPEAVWPALVGLLDAPERARAARFRFERDRLQHVAAHALKRLMLSAAVGPAEAPQAWRFDTAGGGKPRVLEGAGPSFNLSHCDGLVACAVSRRFDVGIDVERVTQEVPFALADNEFAPDEAGWLRSLPAPARASGFFRLWTLKEACLKAAGLGLAQPMRDVAFSFDPLTVSFGDPVLGDTTAWRFHEAEIGDRHMLALAWRSDTGAIPVDVGPVDLEDLVSRAVGGAGSSAASSAG